MHRAARQRAAAPTAQADPSRRTPVGREHSPAGQLEQLQAIVGNRAVGRLLREGVAPIGRAPEPGAPPKRPKPTGKRSDENRWIKGDTIDRPAPTFAQIYMAVHDAQEETIFPQDLLRLDIGELRTLDGVAARRFARFAELYRQKRADPATETPSDVPDIEFEPAAKGLRRFREGALKTALEKQERRHKALMLIDPWADAAWNKYADDPFGEAFASAIPAVRTIVEAELAGKEYAFESAGLLRYGYLSYAGAKDIIDGTMPKGLDKAGAKEHIDALVLAKIQEHRSILPAQIADAMLNAGEGKPEQPGEFIKRVDNLRVDFRRGITLTQQQRVGSVPYDTGHPPPPANVVWEWFEAQAARPNSLYAAFADFLAEGNKDELTVWAEDAADWLKYRSGPGE